MHRHIRHQPWVGGLAGVVLFRDGERERERGRGGALLHYKGTLHVLIDDDDDADDDDDQTEPSSAAPLFLLLLLRH